MNDVLPLNLRCLQNRKTEAVKTITAHVAIVILALCASAPVLAVKPGSTGGHSTATLGITLIVHPTIRAQHVKLAHRGIGQSGVSPADYLCLEMHDTAAFSVYTVSHTADGTKMAPVARWSVAEASTPHAETASSTCPVTLALDLSDVYKHGKETVTLIVSPE